MSFSVICVFLLFNLVIADRATLKQLHILFRHGERSPTKTYPNDPHINYNWSGGWDQLTNKGKLQVYNLGQQLKNHYKDFITDYYWHKDVNVSSSYADRCLMSAELICAGMFPPIDNQIWNYNLLWQPVPIKYVPRSQDTLIAMKASCEKYDEMFNKVMNSSKVQNIMTEYKNLFTYLTRHTGMIVNDLGTVETLFNTLEIEKLNNLTLPSWVNDTLMETMEKLGALNLALYSETDFMKSMKGGVFLKHIITSMMEILKGENKPSLMLYSGHDLTLVHVLRSFNLVDTIKPSFGASLIIELYSDSEVKIIYRNSWDAIPEVKTLNACEPPCNFTQFSNVLEAILPTNWNQMCKIDTN